jgi:hypothetical protein
MSLQVLTVNLIVIFVIIILVMALLDPRKNRLLHLRKRSDERSGWDAVGKYDPEHRKEILEKMVIKELQGEAGWFETYKVALDQHGITELEVKRLVEIRKQGTGEPQ